MKTSAGFWIGLLVMGMFIGMILLGVSAEVFDIDNKTSESQIDHRDMKLVNFESGSKLYIEPDYIDYIPLILDGNENTGINYNFGPDHEQMFFELIFPEAYLVSNITVKPTFGGGTSAYTMYINSNSIYSPWLAQDVTTQKTFHLNCSIIGIWFWLDSNGTNHYYFNDIIINYDPRESFQNQISDLTAQIVSLDNEIDNLTIQINNLENELDNLDSEVEDLKQKAEFDIMDLFIEPPFTGFLWILVIIILILSIRRPKPTQLHQVDESTEPEDKPLPPPPPNFTPPSGEGEIVKGRFCPNCKKYTEEGGPFCPHCKRSMV